MKIMNYSVEYLVKVLYELPLRGTKSRMRTRFVKILTEYLDGTLLPEQKYLIEQYAETDENGEFVLSKDGARILLKKESAQEHHQEYLALMNEAFHIEETEGNKKMLLSVSESILEGDFEVSGELAQMYDIWCEEFEQVIERYGNPTL